MYQLLLVFTLIPQEITYQHVIKCSLCVSTFFLKSDLQSKNRSTSKFQPDTLVYKTPGRLAANAVTASSYLSVSGSCEHTAARQAAACPRRAPLQCVRSTNPLQRRRSLFAKETEESSFYRAACMQRGPSDRKSVCPSVRPSVCHGVNCDETKAPSEKSSIMTNRKSPTTLPMSLR